MNQCGGVLASFNLQGAAWSRRQRKYAIHNPEPPTLSTTVSPADLPAFKVGISLCAVQVNSGLDAAWLALSGSCACSLTPWSALKVKHSNKGP